ncbi:hypothetical protein SLA2020_371980 [Shorea laevis]
MESRITCISCNQIFSVSPYARTEVWCPACRQLNILYPGVDGKFSTASSIGANHSKIRRKISGSSSHHLKIDTSLLPLASSSSQYLRKRAVLCGVSYKNCKHKLKGTVNDAMNMKHFLKRHFDFHTDQIRLLTEETDQLDLIPTKRNIEKALSWLVEDCQSGDSLVFFYSGHGLRQPDFDNDEIDGFDETICPVDFEKEGMIVDNYINDTIVRPLKAGVTLHAIVDACHSGTVLDLVHVYSRHRGQWEDNRPPSGVDKGTSGGLAICISACEDDQLASDTSAFESKMNGAMTFLLTDVVKSHLGITYGNLLDKIYNRIEKVNRQGCINKSRILRKLCKTTITQKPLLSSSEEFDLYKKQFRL